jgi:hypothetical protein
MATKTTENKSTFTPGPWRAEYRTPKLYPDRGIVILADSREIADVIGCDGMTTCNARLIAAAPAMRDACKALLMHIAMEACDRISAKDEAVVAAQAAIALAEKGE